MNSTALESIFSEHEKYRELRVIYIDSALLQQANESLFILQWPCYVRKEL